MSDKLERRPQPDIYCPLCLGYGWKALGRGKQTLDGKEAVVRCENCGGSGWIKE